MTMQEFVLTKIRNQLSAFGWMYVEDNNWTYNTVRIRTVDSETYKNVYDVKMTFSETTCRTEFWNDSSRSWEVIALHQYAGKNESSSTFVKKTPLDVINTTVKYLTTGKVT